MSGPRPETVIFDLDGTLVDTAPDLAAALNAVLAAQGRPEVGLEAVRHMVGRGARYLIERALATAGTGFAPDAIDAFVQDFIAHYDANIAVASRPFPGAESLVHRFAAQGRRLGICTNKPEALSLKLLGELNLLPLFPAVLGAGSRPWRKPDPRHLLDTVTALGGDARNAVLIGDSDTDVKTARAAGIPVVVLAHGYTEIPVRELGADLVLEGFDGLEDALERLFARA